MPIFLIDKIKQKNNGLFKLLDSRDIEWDNETTIPKKVKFEDVYTKAEVEQKINSAGHITRKVLGNASQLPSTGVDNVIYMAPKSDSEAGNDIYNEYMWINNKYEIIGNSKVDLSDYVKYSDISWTPIS